MIDIDNNESMIKLTTTARQGGKSEMLSNFLDFSFGSYRFEEIIEIKEHTVNDKKKDWESKIPNPDPFVRDVSSPNAKARAKARMKRKKKK